MKPLSRCLLMAATLGLVTVSTPALAAEEAPHLWTGTIRSAAGGGAPAEVTAYLQPPVERLPGEEEVRLDPISSTTADRNGRFTLRAGYDDRTRAAEDPAGWISVLVVATTSDGMSMAMDSVRYDAVHDRWSTRPAEAEREGAIKAQTAGVDAMGTERPAVMTLHRSLAPAESRFHAMGARPKICYMKKGTRDVGVTPVTVGELDLDQNWGGQFNYTDTKTSTFEVGFKYEQQGVWSAGGSTSFSKNGSSESINPVDPARHYRHHFYRADMMFSTFRMDCGGRIAYELRPTMWTGGMRTEGAGTMGCMARYKIAVPAGSTLSGRTARARVSPAPSRSSASAVGRPPSTHTPYVTPSRTGIPGHGTSAGCRSSQYEVPLPAPSLRSQRRSSCRGVFRGHG